MNLLESTDTQTSKTKRNKGIVNEGKEKMTMFIFDLQSIRGTKEELEILQQANGDINTAKCDGAKCDGDKCDGRNKCKQFDRVLALIKSICDGLPQHMFVLYYPTKSLVTESSEVLKDIQTESTYNTR